MKIVVCLKQVPARDSSLSLNADADWIVNDDVAPETNEPDTYALEEALRLAEDQGGEVIAVVAGSARAGSTVREALAKGAHRGVLIEDDRLEKSDALVTGRALAAAIAKEGPDLVLTGLQSDDSGFGQTGVVVAELLGLPHITIVIEAKVEDGRIHVKRELESGWFQRIDAPLPALLTIQSGINKPRYATLMGIKKARSKPLTTYSCDELGVDLTPGQRIERLYAPPKSKRTELLEGSPAEQAAKLVEKLRSEARVL